MPRRDRFATPLLTALLGTLLLAAAAQAQVYRVVGPDGRVTYSDQPPAQPGADVAGGASSGAGSGAALPYTLTQTMQRYPVTLYSGKNCAPCDGGRNLLVNRGVPFTERTVESSADIAALQRLAGAADLPVVTIGAQRLKGYSDSEWTQFLDAAGYPKTSQLPASYRRPAATPLVATQPAPRQTATDAAPDSAASAPAEPSVTPLRTPTNPAGIRF